MSAEEMTGQRESFMRGYAAGVNDSLKEVDAIQVQYQHSLFKDIFKLIYKNINNLKGK